MIYNTPEKLEFSSIVEERRSNLVYDVIVVHLPTQIERPNPAHSLQMQKQPHKIFMCKI